MWGIKQKKCTFIRSALLNNYKVYEREKVLILFIEGKIIIQQITIIYLLTIV